jgi:hypothetical protein
LALVFAELDLQLFDRFGTELPAQLPAGATWIEIDRSGTVLTRYPGPERWIGKAFPDSGLLPTLLTQPEGVFEEVSSEGVQTFYAFSSRRSDLAKGEAISVLSIPRQVLFAAADQTLRTNLLWLAVAAALACMLGWVAGNF